MKIGKYFERKELNNKSSNYKFDLVQKLVEEESKVMSQENEKNEINDRELSFIFKELDVSSKNKIKSEPKELIEIRPQQQKKLKSSAVISLNSQNECHQKVQENNLKKDDENQINYHSTSYNCNFASFNQSYFISYGIPEVPIHDYGLMQSYQPWNFYGQNNLNNNFYGFNFSPLNYSHYSSFNYNEVNLYYDLISYGNNYSQIIFKLNSVNSNVVVNFCLSTDGKNYLLKNLNLLADMPKSILSKKNKIFHEDYYSQFTKIIVSKICTNFNLLISHENGCEIIVKMIKSFSVDERIDLWKEIIKANFFNLSCFKHSSMLIVNILNTIKSKLEEIFVLKFLASFDSSNNFVVNYEKLYTKSPLKKSVDDWLFMFKNINSSSQCEEYRVLKIITNTKLFYDNCFFLFTFNFFTATIAQTIIGNFTILQNTGLDEFINLNFIYLSSHNVGKLIIEKFIIRSKNEIQLKKKLLKYIEENLSLFCTQKSSMDILAKIIEHWEVEFSDIVFNFLIKENKAYFYSRKLQENEIKNIKEKEKEFFLVNDFFNNLLSLVNRVSFYY